MMSFSHKVEVMSKKKVEVVKGWSKIHSGYVCLSSHTTDGLWEIFDNKDTLDGLITRTHNIELCVMGFRTIGQDLIHPHCSVHRNSATGEVKIGAA